MPDFNGPDDSEMRERILQQLRDMEGFSGSPEIRVFAVTRTNDRKGYRDARPFNNSSPYQDDPKVLVQIEMEFSDRATPEMPKLVEDIKRIEREKQIAEATERLRRAEADERTAVERRERATEVLRRAQS